MDLGMQILCLLNIFAFSLSLKNDSLKMVQILFRHGDRTPTYIYKNDPHANWTEGLGQLTNVGKEQMYHLGLLLRKNYAEFISPYYLPEKIFMKSSYADRCLMSAELVLAGLFPPTDNQIWNPSLLWQPIPVHYLPRTMDTLIAAKKPCPAYDVALKAAYLSDRITRLNEINKDLYKNLSKFTNETINNITIAETIYNILEIEQFNNLTLPEWTKNISLDALRLLASESLAIFTDTKLMQRLRAGPLLRDIINNMLKKVNSSYLDLVLYSGHDVTIVNLLRTLGFYELLLPSYGAYIIFELHHINNKYEIRVLYGDNYFSSAKQLNLSFCNSSCLLEDFIIRLKDVTPVDWERECAIG